MDPKKSAAHKAVELVPDHQAVGLGGGSTIASMVDYIQEKVKMGMDLKLYTSSTATRELLRQSGMEVHEMSAARALDFYFDGCDQFDNQLNALKSGGGIHTHEKLLASMAEEFILVADQSKWVQHFDNKFPLVAELIPEAIRFAQSKVEGHFKNARTKVRCRNNSNEPIQTSNHNLLLDIWFHSWPPLDQINPFIESLCGVLETSLFYNMAGQAIIGTADGSRVIRKPA
jgi:ribose 5-phosphate isomerase A